MRKVLAVIIYTLVILLIGRNLTSLPRFTVFSNPKNTAAELKKEIEKVTKDKKGNYGIYFADLKNGTAFGSNEYEIFTAASVNKVALITALYHLAEQGEFDLDEQITLQKRDIQDYGTGSLRYEKPGSTYSYKTLAKLALKQSDNTAAYIIGQKVGHGTAQAVIDKFGLTQTSIDDNTTSSYDLYLLFSGIYTNRFVSEPHAKELLGYMTETDIEDRLPALLPADATIAHKTGDAVGFLHDAGIITRGEDVYFISVLTSDIGTDETETKTTIAEIAKTILTYYEKRK
jgi:beta-lactamase class A